MGPWNAASFNQDLIMKIVSVSTFLPGPFTFERVTLKNGSVILVVDLLKCASSIGAHEHILVFYRNTNENEI